MVAIFEKTERRSKQWTLRAGWLAGLATWLSNMLLVQDSRRKKSEDTLDPRYQHTPAPPGHTKRVGHFVQFSPWKEKWFAGHGVQSDVPRSDPDPAGHAIPGMFIKE